MQPKSSGGAGTLSHTTFSTFPVLSRSVRMAYVRRIAKIVVGLVGYVLTNFVRTMYLAYRDVRNLENSRIDFARISFRNLTTIEVSVE
jgi:hypothetical protein